MSQKYNEQSGPEKDEKTPDSTTEKREEENV